jgi:glucosamine-6-phosphate deaminase
MRVIILKNAAKVAELVANSFVKQTSQKSDSVFGLATGGTPVASYARIVEQYKSGLFSAKNITTFNLDEYVGLQNTHPQSYRFYMEQNLFNHIDIAKENCHLPDGMSDDLLKECERYEQIIQNCGGIDWQLLGIGRNGHIGFNEPGSSLGSNTRPKALSKATLQDNQRFFKAGMAQPTLSLTMGIGTISRARKVVVMAYGANKAQACKDMIEGPVSAKCPASALQWHKNVIVYLDQEASSLLELKEYYNLAESEQRILENIR